MIKRYGTTILFLILLGLNFPPLYANSNVTARVVKELDNIETTLPDIEKMNERRYSKTKGSLSISGMLRYNLRFINEQVSPTNIKNRQGLYKHTSAYEPNLKLSFYAAPLQDICFFSTLGFELDSQGKQTGTIKLCNDFFGGMAFDSSLGKYNILLGGPWWMKNSPLTFSSPGWSFRTSPFDRNSWDPVGNAAEYYSSLTKREGFSGDIRSEGGVAIKGIYLDAVRMPLNLYGNVFFGLTDQWNGTESALMFSKIGWKLDKNQLGFAFKNIDLNPHGAGKSEGDNRNASLFFQGEVQKGVQYYTEYAYSVVEMVHQPLVEDFGIIGNLSIKQHKFLFLKGFVLKGNFYYIRPDFVGGNSGIYHTRLPYYIPGIWYADNPQPDSDIMYNNRIGYTGALGFNVLGGMINIIFGNSKNIKDTVANVNFPHSLDHSIWYYIFGNTDIYCKNRSYNGDLGKYWDGASETFLLKETNRSQKCYNMLLINVGYDLSEIFGQTYLLFNCYFKEIDKKFSLVPVKNSTQMLYGTFYDFFLAKGIFQNFYLVGYLAKENWSSSQTIVSIIQEEISYGAGFNYEFVKNSALYFNYKRYAHFDGARLNNSFKGDWYSLELKSFF